MTSINTSAAIDDLVHGIVRRFTPERVILFGSHANGTADEGSDIDLLIVMETPLSPLRQAIDIYLTLDHAVPVDLLVRTPEQIAARNPQDLILRTILQEGATVYEAGG